MASSVNFVACFMACCAITGCSANDLMLKRQAEVEARVEHLIQTDQKNMQYINNQAGQIQVLDDQVRAYSAQIQKLQTTLQEIRTAQDELKVRVVLLAQQTSSPKIEVVNQESSPKTKDNGPPAEYVKAFGLYSANNFPPAIEAFEGFLKNTPQSDYAANALYWIGECHYSLSDLPKALATFQKVVENFPKSAKASDALLKQGYTLAAMKEKDRAAAVYEALIKSYPSSPAAAKARERLTAN